MTLRDDILADPACATALSARDCTEMARIRSIGRTRPNAVEVGNGTILGKIGMVNGMKLLDELNNNTLYRYVKPLLDQGRMLIGDPLVQATLQSMVPTFVSQADANALCTLGKEDWPYTMQEVGEALYNPDGTSK